MSNHDDLVDIIRNTRLNKNHTNIHEFSTYWKGEVDLHTSNNNYALIFEMKSNNTSKGKKRAHNQLNRAEKYFFDKEYRVFKFYVYWTNHASKEYNIEWYINGNKI